MVKQCVVISMVHGNDAASPEGPEPRHNAQLFLAMVALTELYRNLKQLGKQPTISHLVALL